MVGITGSNLAGSAPPLTPTPRPASFPPMETEKLYTLIGPDGSRITSTTKGTIGGYRKERRYGRLDCKAARRALANGALYAQQRVFFADEATAIAAGYHPCSVCMPVEYKKWRAAGGHSARP